MRTRFEIYFQVWIRDLVKKIDRAKTMYGILEAIEDIYNEKLRGRGLTMWNVTLVEMIDNMPLVLLPPTRV
jgi:hypothetical protein